jgi:hypothetical protein
MKTELSFTVTLVLLVFFLYSNLVSGQITDAEKALRTVRADTTLGWKKGGVIAINLAQTSLSNWAAGGQNSVAVNGIFSAFANYKRGNSVWDNSLDVGYGLLKQGKSTGYRKTDDKFDFLSKYGQQAFKSFYYAVLFNFKTQMAPGYNYPNDSIKISDFFSPAYLVFALGMDFKPNTHFRAFIAPVTARVAFVREKALSDAGAFGVVPGKKSKSEFGGYLRAIYTRNDFKSEFLKNVSFTTKVDLFSNYTDKPQNIVVNWETLLALKVNKYISANLNTQLLYDGKIAVPTDRNGNGIVESGESVKSKIQFKEILGVGFSYNF